MAEIYGHKFTSAHGENPNAGAALTWAKGLGGLTAEQLADGLRACIACTDPWPPTLPEFRAMALGIPSLAAVKHELQHGPRSQFTVMVWGSIDSYSYRVATSDASDRMVREAYTVTKEKVMRGMPLPPVAAAELEHEAPSHVPASPEVAAACIAEIAEMLGVRPLTFESDLSH